MANYVARNPFSHSKSFCSELSIDFVKIFIGSLVTNSTRVGRLLCSLGCPPYLIRNREGLFSITHQAEMFKVYFRCVIVNGFYQGYSVKIFSPKHNVLCYLDAIFSGLYSVGQIEFSVDLYSKDPSILFTLINSTMAILWPGILFKHKYLTCYACDIRKNRSKGARAYIKEINGEIAVRVEIILKRRLLRKTIHSSSLTTLNQIHAEDIFDVMKFNELKTDTIRKKYRKILLKELGEDAIAIKFYTMLFSTALVGELAQGFAGTLKLISAVLGKGVYSRAHPFQERFMESIHGRTFIS